VDPKVVPHRIEIDDEHDYDEGPGIFRRGKNEFSAKARTTIEDFNAYFGSPFGYFPNCLYRRGMTENPCLTLTLCPATITVHNYGNMFWQLCWNYLRF
jgi:hypothetical protein